MEKFKLNKNDDEDKNTKENKEKNDDNIINKEENIKEIIEKTESNNTERDSDKSSENSNVI